MEIIKSIAERTLQRAEEALGAETTPLGAELEKLCANAERIAVQQEKLMEKMELYKQKLSSGLAHGTAMLVASKVVGERTPVGEALQKTAQTVAALGVARRQLSKSDVKLGGTTTTISVIRKQLALLQTKRLDLDVFKAKFRRASTAEEKNAIQPQLQRAQSEFTRLQTQLKELVLDYQKKVQNMKKSLLEFVEAQIKFHTMCVKEATTTTAKPMAEAPRPFPDNLMQKIVRSKQMEFPKEVSSGEIQQLCAAATDAFKRQPSLVEIHPPVMVCGDVHGQFPDLMRIFNCLGTPPEKKYLFLGDYVDRGAQSLETIMLLLCYKVKYPTSIVLLRGNHETSNINATYGFKKELEERYPAHSQALFDSFNDVFAWMPLTGLIGQKILCMHGGISDKIRSIEQLKQLERPMLLPPTDSLHIDLMWADPMEAQGQLPNPRGAGVLFGEDVVIRTCQLLKISCIIRAHQFIQSGYEPMFNHRLITVFSAPAYTGQTNTGADSIHQHSNYRDSISPILRIRNHQDSILRRSNHRDSISISFQSLGLNPPAFQLPRLNLTNSSDSQSPRLNSSTFQSPGLNSSSFQSLGPNLI
ncbi:hypothetical protein niasHS_007903 [Heterodera schachtii]|uniref:Serine/threonine-protein phosphatase n=1 Tax=Heterodera schachtii TaxID=97005 RepID=A0ABD2JQE7_HETSC